MGAVVAAAALEERQKMGAVAAAALEERKEMGASAAILQTAFSYCFSWSRSRSFGRSLMALSSTDDICPLAGLKTEPRCPVKQDSQPPQQTHVDFGPRLQRCRGLPL